MNLKKRCSYWVKFPRRCKFGRIEMLKGGNKRPEREAGDDGFSIYILVWLITWA